MMHRLRHEVRLCANSQSRSLLLQLGGAVLIWAYVVTLHFDNDGLWFYGDAPRNAANGIFWWDFLTRLPVNPLQFAVSYYARYPVINPTGWPPGFYMLEALAYQLFGISPFVAKALVLAFTLLGIAYLMLWLRRWVGSSAAWGALLFALQPGIIVWSHAVMLNLPSAILGMAALYHWRRWLEEPQGRHLYPAAFLCVAAILTYSQVAVLVVIMLAWMLMEKKTHLAWRRRTLAVITLSAVPLAAWAFVMITWAPYRLVALYQGEYPLWHARSWLVYFEHLTRLVSIPVLVLAIAGILMANRASETRREARFALTWFSLSYVWFSLASIKEPRYVLLLVPPVICLAVSGVLAVCEWIGRWSRRDGRRAIVPTLFALLVAHVAMAFFVQVPRIQGIPPIVSFIRQVAPRERVFYEGILSGIFSFYLRADDRDFNRGVVVANKLLYATKTEAKFGLVEIAVSTDDVVRRLRDKCGCRFLVVERQVGGENRDIAAVQMLRQVLRRDSFRLVRSFHVGSRDVSDIDVYEQIGAVARPSALELPFPVLGNGVSFDARPIER